MSTSEPAGTWQYAQAVVLPSGARVGSHGAYWTNRTYGRSGWRPAATSRLRRGDLVERPAEVDRRRAARPVGRPRDRAVERPVHLEDARAVAEPLGAAPDPAGSRSPAMATSLARRDVEEDGPRRRQLVERRDPMVR